MGWDWLAGMGQTGGFGTAMVPMGRRLHGCPTLLGFHSPPESWVLCCSNAMSVWMGFYNPFQVWSVSLLGNEFDAFFLLGLGNCLAAFQLMLPMHKEGSVFFFMKAFIYVPSVKHNGEMICLQCFLGGWSEDAHGDQGYDWTNLQTHAGLLWGVCTAFMAMGMLGSSVCHWGSCQGSVPAKSIPRQDARALSAPGCTLKSSTTSLQIEVVFVLEMALFLVSVSRTLNRSGCEYPGQAGRALST